MFGGKSFDADKEIPDLTGKTFLVTGGIFAFDCRHGVIH